VTTDEGSKSYHIGDVGAGARVAQGENISWQEGISALPDGKLLQEQFATLLVRIAEADGLDDDTRDLAREKIDMVATALEQVGSQPARLRRALADAKVFLTASAEWVWDGLRSVLTSDAAQKTIGTITEATATAAIKSLLG
jgi:hypothetical protein